MSYQFYTTSITDNNYYHTVDSVSPGPPYFMLETAKCWLELHNTHTMLVFLNTLLSKDEYKWGKKDSEKEPQFLKLLADK